MNVSAKSALPPLVAKELAAELIRLPLLRTELALQSHDFFRLISIAYIVRRRSRQAFCISFVNTALKLVARRRTTCTRFDQRLGSITSRQKHNRFEYNYRNSNRFHTAGSLEHKFTMAESKNTTFQGSIFSICGAQTSFQ